MTAWPPYCTSGAAGNRKKQSLRLRLLALATIFFPETLNPPATLDYPLPGTGVKGMALGTYLYPDLFFCGACLNDITAGTYNPRFVVIGMNIRFHAIFTSAEKSNSYQYNMKEPPVQRKKLARNTVTIKKGRRTGLFTCLRNVRD
jgi:hypothetical protein